MTYSDALLFYARKGFFKPFRNSAFRKFRRRNRGNSFTAGTRSGFFMNTIIGDTVDNEIYVNEVFEEGTTHVIECLAPESECFLDVGCNIGYYSCLFGTMNHHGKPLFAFDPNPAMIRRTEENLRLNNIGNYKLVACGIGSKRDNLTLNIPRFRHSLSSFAYVPDKGGGCPVESIQVKVMPLQDAINEYSIRKALIKIDTEGFEYQVFCGLSDDAVNSIKFIVFELSASNLCKAGISPGEIFSLPLLQAFDVYRVHEENGGFITEEDPMNLVGDGDINTNVLLVRKDAESIASLRRTAIRRR